MSSKLIVPITGSIVGALVPIIYSHVRRQQQQWADALQFVQADVTSRRGLTLASGRISYFILAQMSRSRSTSEQTTVTEHADAGAIVKLTPAVRNYVAEVVSACCQRGQLVSVVVFGSSATGGYQESISDVDLLLVLSDDAGVTDRERIREIVARLETRHGVAKPASRRVSRLAEALTRFTDRITANQRTFFICTRADLLSGEPRRILNLPGAQVLFVDRVAIPSIIASGITIWGEHLLNSVPLPPIRRLDVAKAFFGLFNTVLLSAAVYAVLPEATKYAMDALKRSIHNCYFVHNGQPASLTIEVAYFERCYGSNTAFAQLLSLRRQYRPSFPFIAKCVPALVKLHLRAALDLTFPREVRVQRSSND